MAIEDYFIVAIELGSSKLTGVAGRKMPDGSIQVLAMAQENSASFIRKGIIFNVDKTAQCLTSIVQKLQTSLKKNIGCVYVGIGGQGLHTVKNAILRELEAETVISQDLVDAIHDSNRETPFSDKFIFEAIPQEYKVGTQNLLDPVGVLSDRIEGRFLNIITRSTIHNNLTKCFAQAGIKIAECVPAPLMLANSVLTEAEKRSGCALVDFGADTTTVAVYKNNLLRHLVVIPLGSSNITRDLTSLQIEEDEAEALKLQYGSAYTDIAEMEEGKSYTLRDGRTLSQKDFCDIVEARVEEILVNVADQIRRSGFDKSTLLAGIILTGGGSNMKNLERAVAVYTGFDKFKTVKNVLLTVNSSIADVKAKDGRKNSVLGILAAGTVNCCIGEQHRRTLFDEEEEERKRREEEKRQAEEEKRRAEEEERKKREEEERRAEEERLAEEERQQREEEKRRKREEWKKNNIFARSGRWIKKVANTLVNEDE